MTQPSSNFPQWTKPDKVVRIVRNPPIQDAEVSRRFIPPSVETKPLDIFSIQYNRCPIQATRYIANNDRGTVLLYAGSFVQNDTCAGYGVVFGPEHKIIQRLERPPGDNKVTADRATLRAAVCALQIRGWDGEGFDKVVLAMDSEYVVSNACDMLSTWVRKNWKTESGELIKNKDLWEKLLQEMTMFEKIGVRTQFWHIPPELNGEAKAFARQGASKPMFDEFTETIVMDI